MELYMVRHAQSINNALWDRHQSSEGRLPDPGLTELGNEQAARLEVVAIHDGVGGQHGVGLGRCVGRRVSRACRA